MKTKILVLLLVLLPCYLWAASSDWDTMKWDNDVWYKASADAISVPACATEADFRMPSFNVAPTDTSAAAVLGGLIGGSYDTNTMKIGVYDPNFNDGDYREYPDFTVQAGKAIWMWLQHGASGNVDGAQTSTTSDIDVSLAYNASNGNGWNMIGCPNAANYPWNNVEVVEKDAHGNIVNGPFAMSALGEDNAYILKTLYVWASGSYNAITTMTHGTGYWVKSKKANVYLRFGSAAQARLANPKVYLSYIFDKSTNWVKNNFFPVNQAVAYTDSDYPPAPMNISGNFFTDWFEGDTGCFINTVLP